MIDRLREGRMEAEQTKSRPKKKYGFHRKGNKKKDELIQTTMKTRTATTTTTVLAAAHHQQEHGNITTFAFGRQQDIRI